MSKKYKIGILGVTGAVGQQMLKVIEEMNLPVCELRPLASARSAGKTVLFNGSKITIQEANESSFKGLDFVLGAVEAEQSKYFAPFIVQENAVFIDNSSAFRMDENVPLIVPEINGADALKNNGIIANPNCSTIITMMAIAGIAKLSPIQTMFTATYQAVSGAGVAGIKELEDQMAEVVENREIHRNVFSHQIVSNVIPYIGSDTGNGYTSEEMKMQNEGRKILHLPELKVSCTCVRVPVMRSHSIAVTLRTKEKISVSEAIQAVKNYPGCKLIEDYEGRCYPTPLDTSDQDLVWVGRIREDLTDDNGLTLWCCGDQIRKGAATNAVQILKYLIS